jgi:hypothetical protein
MPLTQHSLNSICCTLLQQVGSSLGMGSGSGAGGLATGGSIPTSASDDTRVLRARSGSLPMPLGGAQAQGMQRASSGSQVLMRCQPALPMCCLTTAPG